MHDENRRCLAHSFLWTDRAVCPHIEDEAVVVRDIADTCILYGVVDTVHRGEDGINRNDADGVIRTLIPICRNVAAPTLNGHLNLEFPRLIERCDVKFRIEDLNLAAALDVGCGDLPISLRLNADGVRFTALHADAELF